MITSRYLIGLLFISFGVQHIEKMYLIVGTDDISIPVEDEGCIIDIPILLLVCHCSAYDIRIISLGSRRQHLLDFLIVLLYYRGIFVFGNKGKVFRQHRDIYISI